MKTQMKSGKVPSSTIPVKSGPLMAPKKKKINVKSAIKRPGALTSLVGGKPSKNMGKVNKLATGGSPLQKREANFYKNVLKGGK